MAQWAKRKTKCRICGKKTDDTRLICLGDNDISHWLRTALNIKKEDLDSDRVRVFRSELWHFGFYRDRMLDKDCPEWAEEYRDKAHAFFKAQGVDLFKAPAALYEECSDCLYELRNWALMKGLPVPDSGVMNSKLAVLVDEYLTCH